MFCNARCASVAQGARPTRCFPSARACRTHAPSRAARGRWQVFYRASSTAPPWPRSSGRAASRVACVPRAARAASRRAPFEARRATARTTRRSSCARLVRRRARGPRGRGGEGYAAAPTDAAPTRPTARGRRRGRRRRRPTAPPSKRSRGGGEGGGGGGATVATGRSTGRTATSSTRRDPPGLLRRLGRDARRRAEPLARATARRRASGAGEGGSRRRGPRRAMDAVVARRRWRSRIVEGRRRLAHSLNGEVAERAARRAPAMDGMAALQPRSTGFACRTHRRAPARRAVRAAVCRQRRRHKWQSLGNGGVCHQPRRAVAARFGQFGGGCAGHSPRHLSRASADVRRAPGRKLCVLDLDQTLITTAHNNRTIAAHTAVRTMAAAVIDGYRVIARPGAIEMLRSLHTFCDVAVFTASEKHVALPKLQWLEAKVGVAGGGGGAGAATTSCTSTGPSSRACASCAKPTPAAAAAAGTATAADGEARRAAPASPTRARLADMLLVEDCALAGARQPANVVPISRGRATPPTPRCRRSTGCCARRSAPHAGGFEPLLGPRPARPRAAASRMRARHAAAPRCSAPRRRPAAQGPHAWAQAPLMWHLRLPHGAQLRRRHGGAPARAPPAAARRAWGMRRLPRRRRRRHLAVRRPAAGACACPAPRRASTKAATLMTPECRVLAKAQAVEARASRAPGRGVSRRARREPYLGGRSLRGPTPPPPGLRYAVGCYYHRPTVELRAPISKWDDERATASATQTASWAGRCGAGRGRPGDGGVPAVVAPKSRLAHRRGSASDRTCAALVPPASPASSLPECAPSSARAARARRAALPQRRVRRGRRLLPPRRRDCRDYDDAVREPSIFNLGHAYRKQRELTRRSTGTARRSRSTRASRRLTRRARRQHR